MAQKRYTSVDTLRFLSILAIIFYHYRTYIIPGGFLAVDVFFIISGLFVTRSLIKKRSSDRPPALPLTFFKRAKKNWFPMFVVIAICLTAILLFRHDLLVNVSSDVWSSLTFTNNWQQILSGSSYFQEMIHPSLFTHLWYVAVYMQLMLIWPPLYYYGISRFKDFKVQGWVILGFVLISALAMGLIFTSGEDPTRVYYGTDTRAFTFLIGALLAVWHVPEQFEQVFKIKKWWLLDILTLVLFFGSVALMFVLKDGSGWTYRGGMLLFDGLVALTIAGLMQEHSILRRVFEWKPLVWLSERSFPMYLWYYPIYIVWHSAAKNQNWLTDNIWAQIILIMALALVTDAIIIRKYWTTPIFNPPKGSKIRLFTGIKQIFNRHGKRSAQILFALFVFIYGATAIVLATAPTETNISVQEKAAADQQKQNEERNRKLAEQKEKAEKDFATYYDKLETDDKQKIDNVGKDLAKKTYRMSATFIGDSLTVGVSDYIYTFYPMSVVDAQVGRQLYNTEDTIANLANNGQLADTVVVDLGANGPFTKNQLETMIQQIGKDKTIYLVNTHVDRPWRDQVNSVLEEATSENNHLHLIDWNSYFQANNNNWLEEDGVHLNDTGDQAWIKVVGDAMTK